jgi:hypothetical protein
VEGKRMNCFNHPDRPAVGVCKNCCKGLCADCAATLPNGLACRETCEEQVALLNQAADDNRKLIATVKAQTRSFGGFLLILGVAYFLLGLVGHSGARVVVGLVVGGYGLLRFFK